MIKIRKFDKEKDLSTINEWHIKRNGRSANVGLLPPTCYIASVDEIDSLFVGVYFILDVPIIMLDNFISNPDVGFYKMSKSWIVLFDFIKNLISNVEKLSGREYSIIQCNINERLAKALERHDKDWHFLDSKTIPCFYQLD